MQIQNPIRSASGAGVLGDCGLAASLDSFSIEPSFRINSASGAE
jgi:hypothetical protein